MSLPQAVKVVEVGPRDGLQNETAPVETAVKVELIDRLTAAGLRTVEATSMVNPKWVPQLADAEAVFGLIRRRPGVSYPVLVPNLQGLERALGVGATEIALFTAASESFNQKNINCSIAESLQRFEPVLERARQERLTVRGYISCVLGCPYEGVITAKAVADLAAQLDSMGCDEISLGDTIGHGTPLAAKRMLTETAARVPMEKLAVHFHDTRGQALANILACLEEGVAIVDASVAGLGGCPYAPGAAGNVATEDVVYMLEGMGITTGVDLAALVETGDFISRRLGRRNGSKVGLSMQHST